MDFWLLFPAANLLRQNRSASGEEAYARQSAERKEEKEGKGKGEREGKRQNNMGNERKGKKTGDLN